MMNQEYQGETATQAIYDLEWAPYRVSYGATSALADIDFFCGKIYGCPNKPKFWQDQFSSLYALDTIGKSYYNAAQFTLRHPMHHGLQMDVAYTFSKSIDWGSDAERTSEFSTGVAVSSSNIINTWRPYLNKGVSDFDTANLITADWVYVLPVGKGQAHMASANPLIQAALGGWQWSGIFRATSGLPFSFFEPGWTTDWQQSSYGVVTDKTIRAHKHRDGAGNVLYFQNAGAVNSGVYTGTPERIPYPGETGQRNNFRGDGYLDLDSGLAKMWSVGRFGSLKFTWEVYNITNTNRFDPFSIGASLTGGNLGTASALLTTPRRMQFSMRYDF
jgi:hypothetical protein